MLQITTRLRHHFFRDAFPSVNSHPNPAFIDRLPSFPSYFGRRELSPPGIYSSLGPSFHKFDALSGIPSLSDLRDDRPPFLHRSGAPLLSDRKPWNSQVFNFAVSIICFGYLYWWLFFYQIKKSPFMFLTGVGEKFCTVLHILGLSL